MDKLVPATRAYSWGSKTLIPELLGDEPSPSPIAELWYGAHPADPSLIAGTDSNLAERLQAKPQELGEWSQQGLPFLMKLLAANEVLSLQAHPSLEQAEEGFARENALGLAVNDKKRNYKDASHKPELLVALTPFYAMAGFRPLSKTRKLFAALDCPELDRYQSMLSADDSATAEAANLRALFTTWITIPTAARQQLISAICAAAPKVPEGWMSQVMDTVVKINQQYPGDIGVLGALMLNHVKLAPGEAIFLAAGNLHAYVYGLGVEVMANSDNVLRGGLTPKYVDVPELVKVLKFESLTDPRAEMKAHGNVFDYDTPVDEFAVRRVELTSGDCHTLAHDESPAIALCTSGKITIDATELSPGQALWIPVGSGEQVARTETDSQLFVAHPKPLGK